MGAILICWGLKWGGIGGGGGLGVTDMAGEACRFGGEEGSSIFLANWGVAGRLVEVSISHIVLRWEDGVVLVGVTEYFVGVAEIFVGVEALWMYPAFILTGVTGLSITPFETGLLLLLLLRGL